MRPLLTLLLLSAASPFLWAKDALYLELSAQGQRMDLGLAEFSPEKGEPALSEQARTVREVVKDDLLFPRIFNLVEGGPAPVRRAVNFKAWAETKADLLITGSLEKEKEGRFIFTGALYDVAARQMVLEKKYSAASGQERSVSHLFSDEVLKYFLSQPGIAHTKIYFVNNSSGKKEIYSVDYDGANLTRLTSDRSIALLPKASPDGQWIAYTSFKGGVPRLHVMRSNGSGSRLLCGYDGLNASAAWMPDGQSLVATLSVGKDPNLYQVDLSGKILRALTSSYAVDTAPAVSPDGLRLAFTSDRPGSPQIYLMDSNGANIRRLTRSGECDSASWSPQGNFLAYAQSEGKGNFDIYTMEVVSGATQRLTFGTGNNENPSWSPDGRYLAFISTRRGKSELWVMGADGSNQEPVGSIPGQSFTPNWGP